MAAIYRAAMKSLDKLVPTKFLPFWNHPAGPRTVFFWAPTVKWSLIIAGLGDLTRPAEKLSIGQSGALFATGSVWARYCLVITPKNYYLCSVNVFVAITGMIQLGRIYAYNDVLKKQAALKN